VQVAIVGGGVAGLAAAWRLTQAGVGVTVFEGARVGGVIGTDRERGYLLERAASSFLSASDGASALCDELGVETRAGAATATKKWIFVDGKRQLLPASLGQLLTTGLLTARGKLSLLAEPLRRGRDSAQAGDQSVFDFAARRFGVEFARAVIAPFVTGIFAADAHEISLAAGFPRLAELDRDGGMVRGMFKRALRGQRRPAPKVLRAPVLGMSDLIGALEARLAGHLRREAVFALAPVAQGCVLSLARGEERFDGVVLATPAAVAAALTGSQVPALASALSPIRRAPAAVVYLGFPTESARALADGFGCLVASGERPRVLGVVFESALWPGRAPAGASLFRFIYGGGRDPGATELSDEQLLAQAGADAALVLSVTAPSIFSRVVRHPAGLPRYPVGHGHTVAAAENHARRHRIALAGADYRGIGVNDVVADAARVVKDVLAW
jgi:oxygen-dependent protoporphyrinogen oxidase